MVIEVLLGEVACPWVSITNLIESGVHVSVHEVPRRILWQKEGEQTWVL